MKRIRLAVAVSVVAVIVASVAFIPIPREIMATVVMQPRNAERIYINVPGKLSSVTTKPGEPVKAGQILAQLENTEIGYNIARLIGRKKRLTQQLLNLRRQQADDPAATQNNPNWLNLSQP